jgi:hypothetical protein
VYTVIVCDLFHASEADHETAIGGFPTWELAVEYARRRLRSSVEEFRRPGRTREELRRLWRSFGEDCRVVGPDGRVYRASSELEAFLDHPATPQEQDWVSLHQAIRRGDAS